MSLEKILHKIQAELQELSASFELFFEDTIQPSVTDCEDLQRRLSLLQEDLAIYKYQKGSKEISPSFSIHAKISEKEVPEEKAVVKPAEPEIEIPVVTKEELHPVQKLPVPESQEKSGSPKNHPKLSINLNDKFRFINELFAQNNAEYGIALEQLNNLKSWNDTEIYLNSLKSLYAWNESKDIVIYFYALVKKRFDS